MKYDTKLSIITVNYNNDKGLERTLASVFEQKFTEFEYIVIDGGSTDGSSDLLDQYRERFSHCISEPDRGIYHAMNKGIQLAKGDYLLFLNSGDLFFDSNSLGNFFLSPAIDDIIYANVNFIAPTETYIKKYPDFLDFDYMTRDTLPHQAALIKRNLFIKVGLYDENIKIISDWKFFIVALFTYNATYKHLDFISINYDCTGLSSKPENYHLVMTERHKVYWEYFPLRHSSYSQENMRRIDEMGGSEAVLNLVRLQEGTLNRLRRKSKKSRILPLLWAMGLVSWLRDI